MRLVSDMQHTTFALQPTAMETILKFSVLLFLSITWTNKTNCYKPCIKLELNVAKKEVKETGPKQEMDGFWLTQFLVVEG